MGRLDDEILMAYADGALSAGDARWVETELARDAAAGRLVTLIRSTGAMARFAFDAPIWSDAPLRLTDTIEVTSGSVSKPSTLASLIMRRRLLGAFSTLAAAASVATVLVVQPHLRPVYQLPATMATVSERVVFGLLTSDGELSLVLDGFHTPAPHYGDRRIKLVTPLADKRGNPCQELDINSSAVDVSATALLIICKLPVGSWTVVGSIASFLRSPTDEKLSHAQTDIAARQVLQGVYSMIGAHQRASAIKTESQRL